MSIRRSCLYAIGIGINLDENGGFVATFPTANGGYLIPEAAVNAIIEACIKHNEEYRGIDRDAVNKQWAEQEIMDMEAQNEEARIAIKARTAERRNKPGSVYLVSDIIRGFTKIGYTSNVRSRIQQLKVANAGVEYLRHFDGSYEDEQHLHEHFKQSGKRISSEWFSLDESDLVHIERYFEQKHA